MHDVPGESRVFCKFRRGLWSHTLGEWRALEELQRLGIGVPERLFVTRRGRDSGLGMRSVPGRPMDVLLQEGKASEPALGLMPGLLRRLHGSGWVYRDMYWNHVFLDPEGADLRLIDVERAFRPRWRLRRWIVKDLAGLLASWPPGAGSSRTAGLRFLKAYSGGGLEDGWKGLARRVLSRAAKIRAHVTRYPG